VGVPWFLEAVPDSRWNDTDLVQLHSVPGPRSRRSTRRRGRRRPTRERSCLPARLPRCHPAR
jgi:hypothetical protein